jgi:hypothetical protein
MHKSLFQGAQFFLRQMEFLQNWHHVRVGLQEGAIVAEITNERCHYYKNY